MSLARQRVAACLLLALSLPAASLAQASQPRKQSPPKRNDAPGQLETLMRQAEEAIDKEDFAAAVPLLEKFLVDRPEEPYAQFQLGYSLSRLNRYDEAAARYRKTIELDPKFSAAYQNLGLVLLRAGHPADAVAPLRKAIELQPDAAHLRLLLGDALEKTGDRESAAAQYREAVRLAPLDPDARAALGRLLLEAKKPAEAEPHFRAALEIDPQSPGMHLGLADSLLAQGKLAGAVPHLEQNLALQTSPRPELRFQLASVLFELKEYEKALASLDEAEKGASPTAASSRLRADIYVAQKRYADSAAVMATLFTSHPEEATPDARARLGRVYLELREYKAAQEQLILALRAKPELTEALRDLIGVYYVAENWTGALRLLDELAKREELAAGSWFIRAVCYDKLHMQPEALAAYKQFVALDQGRTERQDFQARQRIKALERAIARKR